MAAVTLLVVGRIPSTQRMGNLTFSGEKVFGVLAVVDNLARFANMKAYTTQWRVMRSETGKETEMYCDNPACDLNVPMKQVVTAPQIRRMDWQARDGSERHFCQTCAEAIITYQAGRSRRAIQHASSHP
jgi:hypothetical protein